MAFAKPARRPALVGSGIRRGLFRLNRCHRCCRFPARWKSWSNSPRCSKTYSMPGWRIGFAVGNERITAALARRKILPSITARSRPRSGGGYRRAFNGPGRLHPRDGSARSIKSGAMRWSNPSGLRRLAGAGATRLDVRLGANSSNRLDLGQRRIRRRFWWKRRASPSRPAPALASMAGEGHVRYRLGRERTAYPPGRARNIRRFLETGPEAAAQRRVPLATRTLVGRRSIPR